MSFSIIIPVFNEENNIKSCLQSIKRFNNKVEVIVVDGGSIDDTLAISKPLADKIIASTKGRAKQMNAGAKQAAGDMLLFLHADTMLPNNALTLIDQTPLLGNCWGRFDIQLSGKIKALKVISALMNWRSRITGIATGDQVIFVSKKLFDEVKGYDDIFLMEDISLCTKLKKISSPLCLNEKVISSGRRWEKNGLVKTILLMWSLRIRYFFGENTETLSILYLKGRFWKT